MNYGLRGKPPDTRDWPMRIALPGVGLDEVGRQLMAGRPPPPREQLWAPGPILHQGDRPLCVTFSWKQLLQCQPIAQGLGLNTDGFHQLAQERDEWPGTDRNFGTSIRAGAKVLKLLGAIESYVWTDNVWELAYWVLTKGPVVMAMDYWTGWDRGLQARVDGDRTGGHSVVCIGCNGATQQFLFVNSWGEGWGHNGMFALPAEDVQMMFRDYRAQACAPVEAKL